MAVQAGGYEEPRTGGGTRATLTVHVAPPSAVTRVGKRVLDLLVGVPLALLALPFVAVLAVGSAITLRAWPLFVQRRVGRGGREFPFVKLRTLPTSAPSAVDKYHLDGVRIPAFCRFLRHRHLDELPQLLLVPIGWMSLVGPRPDMPKVLAHYPAELAEARSCVRPGCTGLWQVSTSVSKLIYEAPEYDVAYVLRGSVRLDLWILVRTFRVYLPRPRYIESCDIPKWTLGRGFLERQLPIVQMEHEVLAPHFEVGTTDAAVALIEPARD